MGSLTVVTDKAGNLRYKLTITRTNIYRETRSFDTQAQAHAWEKKREAEVDALIAANKPISKEKDKGATLGDAIDKYTLDSMKDIGRTKTQCLQTIRNEYEIADMRCDLINSKHLVEFAQQLRKRPGLSSGSTVMNYMSHLQAVFAVAEVMWGYPLRVDEITNAQKACSKMGITTKSRKRTRRPTLDELDTLLTQFQQANARKPNSSPMHKISVFALFSTRRQEEITRLQWKDYDKVNKRIWVRDMKHPGDKAGNDVCVELPDPCCDIIDNMPKISDRIFPYSTDAISTNWIRACKLYSIEDLHFHDLRHEGVSRLFEMGRTLPLAASVSGHRSWSSLQRYSHIIAKGDKYENWKWIKVVCTPTKHELKTKA